MSDTGHAAAPWHRGRVLLTQQTRRWSKKSWDLNEEYERAFIFDSFTPEDQGRGRRLIAQVGLQHPDYEANARLIVASPRLLEALRGIVETHLRIEMKQPHGDRIPMTIPAEVFDNALYAIGITEPVPGVD